MTWKYPYHFFFLALPALVAFLLAAYLWHRRKAPGGWQFFLLMTSVGIWAFACAAEIVTFDYDLKIIWSKISYLGIVFVPQLWLGFVIRYTGHDQLLSPFRYGLFLIPSAVMLALVMTNERHLLVWPEVTPVSPEPGALLVYGHGPGVLLFMIWSYLLLLAGVIFLFDTIIRSRKLHRRQAMTLIIGAMFPWAGNFLYLLDLLPFQGLDPAPFAFTLTGLVFTVNIFRYQLLDLAPIAYHTLFRNMESGVLVIDSRDRIMEINSAAEHFLAAAPESSGKQPNIGAFLPGFLRDCLEETRYGEVSLGSEDSPQWLEVVATGIQSHGRPVGRLIVLRDITERKRMEMEREEIIRTLQQALSEIRTLQGFIPICCHCKKIRTDEGFWQQIEQYLSEHSEAVFSHGICPECLKEHYPWMESPPSPPAPSPAEKSGRGGTEEI